LEGVEGKTEEAFIERTLFGGNRRVTECALQEVLFCREKKKKVEQGYMLSEA